MLLVAIARTSDREITVAGIIPLVLSWQDNSHTAA